MTTTETDLWRGVREEEFPDGVVIGGTPAAGILHPDFVARPAGNGVRGPDVVVVAGMVQTRGGTSLFDKDKFFKGKKWLFFKIPKGTEIDPLLIVRWTNFNGSFGADHYQIEVAKPIPVASYIGALDNFARAAVAKAFTNAH